MDQEDRYFVLSLFSLALSLFFLPMTLYLIPQAWFGWTYHMPDFILSFQDFFQMNFGLTSSQVHWLVMNLFFVTGLMFSVLTYVLAKKYKIDRKKELPHEVINESWVRSKQAKERKRQKIVLLIKISIIFVLVYSIAEVVQWTMSVTSST